MACNNNSGNKTHNSDIEHAAWSNNYKVRFGSGSSEASQNSGDICRICHCESDPQNPLLTPCYCSGSLKYVHQACLQQWLTASETNACELCKFPFIMHAKIKPFNEWRSLDISGIERRRLLCSVLFHCAAALCVIWSLCVLIERAADDIKNGLIDWPFWTKLAVVAVGLTGSIVFMYIQCKTYLHLCHRWKARNRILLIQNAPEKMHPNVSQSISSSTRQQQQLQHQQQQQQSQQNYHYESERYNRCASTTTTGGRLHNVNDVHFVYGNNNIAPAGEGYTPVSTAVAVDVTYDHHHRNHDHYEMPTSHHHVDYMNQHSDVDIDSVASQTSSSRIIKMHQGKHNFFQQQQHLQQPQQQQQQSAHHNHYQQQQLNQMAGPVAVAANIEHNYERDFPLDDVISQLSSFQPCIQGSGSMTPFHDSIHNVLEHSENSSRISVNDVCIGSRQNLSAGGLSTDTGHENVLQLSSLSGSGDHKAPSISSGVSHAVANGLGGFVYKPHVKLYSNSSIFLENHHLDHDHDLLNDVDDGNCTSMDLIINYSPNISTTNIITVESPRGFATGPNNKIMFHSPKQRTNYLNKEMRRNSDTKLLDCLINTPYNHYNNEHMNNYDHHEYLMQKSYENENRIVENLMANNNKTEAVATTVANIETATATVTTTKANFKAEVKTDAGVYIEFTRANQQRPNIYKNHIHFKSLPNLTATKSCENLIRNK